MKPSPRGETAAKKYALPIPEPVKLWKWAARHSRRHGDGLPLGLAGFYKRAVRATDRVPPETHGEFARRALLAATRKVMADIRQAGGTVPVGIEELLAGEITATNAAS